MPAIQVGVTGTVLAIGIATNGWQVESLLVSELASESESESVEPAITETYSWCAESLATGRRRRPPEPQASCQHIQVQPEVEIPSQWLGTMTSIRCLSHVTALIATARGPAARAAGLGGLPGHFAVGLGPPVTLAATGLDPYSDLSGGRGWLRRVQITDSDGLGLRQ